VVDAPSTVAPGAGAAVVVGAAPGGVVVVAPGPAGAVAVGVVARLPAGDPAAGVPFAPACPAGADGAVVGGGAVGAVAVRSQ
jgi:hypothetical protein